MAVPNFSESDRERPAVATAGTAAMDTVNAAPAMGPDELVRTA